MKVVLLCGGLGTRMKEETEYKPKPLVNIGDKPILWHILKLYSSYGFNEFILCLGYKGEMIKEYFLDYNYMNNDFTIELGLDNKLDLHGNHNELDWQVTLANTGLSTNTGGRIKRIEKYIDSDSFFVTYADGLSDVNIEKTLSFHKKKGKIATLTAVQPFSRYGVIETGEDNLVNGFTEKPRLDGWVNAGFFVFNQEIFDHLNENTILEKEPLETLSKSRQLAAYQHRGFWKCMDTFKDAELLNDLWDTGQAPWKIWE